MLGHRNGLRRARRYDAWRPRPLTLFFSLVALFAIAGFGSQALAAETATSANPQTAVGEATTYACPGVDNLSLTARSVSATAGCNQRASAKQVSTSGCAARASASACNQSMDAQRASLSGCAHKSSTSGCGAAGVEQASAGSGCHRDVQQASAGACARESSASGCKATVERASAGNCCHDGMDAQQASAGSCVERASAGSCSKTAGAQKASASGCASRASASSCSQSMDAERASMSGCARTASTNGCSKQMDAHKASASGCCHGGMDVQQASASGCVRGAGAAGCGASAVGSSASTGGCSKAAGVNAASASCCPAMGVQSAGLWSAKADAKCPYPTREIPLERRTVSLEYAFHVDAPQDGRSVKAWLPIPASTPYQQLNSWQLRQDWPHQVVREDRHGNRFLLLDLSDRSQWQDGRIPVTVTYNVTSWSRQAGVKPMGCPHDPYHRIDARHLQVDHRMPIDGDWAAEAREAVGDAQSTMMRARKLYDHLVRSVAADMSATAHKEQSGGHVCDASQTSCRDLHLRFVAQARALGIPARIHTGLPLASAERAAIEDERCWAEFYDAAHGWVPVDLTQARKHPQESERFFGTSAADRIVFGLGHDLALPGAVSGPQGLAIDPHVEVDGRSYERIERELAYVETAGDQQPLGASLEMPARD